MTRQAGQEQWYEPGRKAFFKLSGAALVMAVAVVLAEIAIQFVPGVSQATQRTMTVADWFRLLDEHPFLGMRNLGLLNLIGTGLLTPAYLAMFLLLRPEKAPWAALGAAVFFVGMAVYLADNRAFEMLSLSRRYAAAGSSADRAALVAAGQAFLVEGLNRLGIALIDSAGLILSAAMLSVKRFGKTAAWTGVAGNGLMIVFEIIFAFVPAWRSEALYVAMGGGVCIIAWYLVIASLLFRQSAAAAAD